MEADRLTVPAPAPVAGRNAYVEFVETFFDIPERRRFASLYLRILRRPIVNAFVLLDELDLRSATRFLQQSVVLYLAFALTSGIANSSSLVDDLLRTASLLLAFSLELGVFYLLAHRTSVRTQERDFRAFLTFAAITSGFTLPLAALSTQLGLSADPALVLAAVGLTIFGLVYSVRVWQRFWGLSAKRAFVYLLVAAVVSLLVEVPGIGAGS